MFYSILTPTNLLNISDYSGDSSDKGITNPVLDSSLQNESGLSFFQKLLPNLITLALTIGAIVFVFIMLTGAIQWITSGGDKQALEAAKSKITNALIGLVIMFVIFALVTVLENFFGIKILTLDIGALIIK